MGRKQTASRHIVKYRMMKGAEAEDDVAVEYPLTIVLNGEEWATVVCTPSDLEEMVLGLLAAEGIVRFPGQIQSLTIDEPGGFAYVETVQRQPVPKGDVMKRFIGSCCGKSRHIYFLNDAKTAKTVTTSLHIPAEDCFRFMDRLHEMSASFRQTGGVHNAALCSPTDVVVARTDIGRHNALDKIYGYCVKHRIPVDDKLIVFSGRVSSEVLLKISKIGVGILLSKSAPTDLAIDLADELNVTVVGFIRGNSFNVYTHPHRIKGLNFKGGRSQHGHRHDIAHS